MHAVKLHSEVQRVRDKFLSLQLAGEGILEMKVLGIKVE